MSAPQLVFGYGNPSRGDDALGPTLIQRLQRRKEAGELPWVDLLTDFQLQVEHALDLVDRERVVFVDADVSLDGPFLVTPVIAERALRYSTHAMSPGAVLGVFERIAGSTPPACLLLAIRGYRFELGASMSRSAQANLDQAEAFLLGMLPARVPCDT